MPIGWVAHPCRISRRNHLLTLLSGKGGSSSL
jgi:hypothetical protein